MPQPHSWSPLRDPELLGCLRVPTHTEGNVRWRKTLSEHGAPRGADGGVDIIAYQDPLGMTPPRVKVQVKHKPDANVPPTDVRALIGVSNRPGEAGLFVTSGKFSNDATREARTSNTHCELIDLDRFIELWREFYTKMPDEDRARLPLHAVWFLGAVE